MFDGYRTIRRKPRPCSRRYFAALLGRKVLSTTLRQAYGQGQGCGVKPAQLAISVLPCVPCGRFSALFTMPRSLFGSRAPPSRDDYPLWGESFQNRSDRAFARVVCLLIRITDCPSGSAGIRNRRARAFGACRSRGHGPRGSRLRWKAFPQTALRKPCPPKTMSSENH